MALQLKVDFDGLEDLQREFERFGKRGMRAFGKAVRSGGIAIMENSIKRVPVDTGRLRGSHYATEPQSPTDPTVEIGYGTNYAVPVHERTEVPHAFGEAKFLEKAVNDVSPRLLKIIGDVARMILIEKRKPPLTGMWRVPRDRGER